MAKTIDLRFPTFEIHAAPNKKAADGMAKTLTSLTDASKTTVDFFGIIGKVAEIVGATAIQAKFGMARAVSAVTYFPKVAYNLWSNPTPRNWLETGKIGGHATAVFVSNPALSKPLVQGATAFGLALDVVDGYEEVRLNRACAQLNKADMTPDAQKVVGHWQWASAWRICKLALTIFAGMVAVGSWLMGIAVSPALATASLVAGLAALCISVFLSYVEHKSEWTTKVSFVPAPVPARV